MTTGPMDEVARIIPGTVLKAHFSETGKCQCKCPLCRNGQVCICKNCVCIGILNKQPHVDWCLA